MPDDAPVGAADDPSGFRDLVARLVPDRDPEAVELLVQLTLLARVTEARLARLAAERGLGPTETAVLLALWATGPPYRVRPGVLAQQLVQTSGGMTATLTRLERAGLVRRRDDPADGRSRLAELTEAGRRAGLASLDHMAADLEAALAAVSPGRRRAWSAAVAGLLDRLRA